MLERASTNEYRAIGVGLLPGRHLSGKGSCSVQSSSVTSQTRREQDDVSQAAPLKTSSEHSHPAFRRVSETAGEYRGTVQIQQDGCKAFAGNAQALLPMRRKL